MTLKQRFIQDTIVFLVCLYCLSWILNIFWQGFVATFVPLDGLGWLTIIAIAVGYWQWTKSKQ